MLMVNTFEETRLGLQAWDVRTSENATPCQKVCLQPEDADPDEFNSINALAMGGSRNTILAALDNGTLASVNLRKQKLEVLSDSMGYSARTITVIKENQSVLVGTEEGALCIFKWNEFESMSDRWVLSSGGASIEHIVRVSDDLVAVAMDDGQINAVHIRPNSLLGRIGLHRSTPSSATGATTDSLDASGDCLSLAVCPTTERLVSVSPNSSIAQLWPLHSWIHKSEALAWGGKAIAGKRSKKISKRDPSDNIAAKRAEHLSGLLPPPEKKPTGGSDDDSSNESMDDDGDSDSDSSS